MGSMDTGATSPRVLVVDDDSDVLASLERGLRLSAAIAVELKALAAMDDPDRTATRLRRYRNIGLR